MQVISEMLFPANLLTSKQETKSQQNQEKEPQIYTMNVG